MRTVKELTRKMKDSGVEWIGEIPEDWEVIRLKNMIGFYSGYAFKENELSGSGDKFVLRIGNIQNNKLSINSDTLKTNLNETTLKNQKVLNEDILIAMSGATVGKIVYIEQTVKRLYINQRVGIIRSPLNHLLKYYFLINGFREYIFLNSQGSAQPNISETEILNYMISLPPKSQQKSIADFLDKKVSQIDNIISKTKKAIEEYKKYKQSLITETVTKGLDENVEMKDSGIEWIGETPEHWDIIRPNRVCKILRGNSSFQKTDLESKGDYIALQYGRTYKVDIVDDSYRHYVDRSFYKSDQIVENGDTVLISTSETMEDLGHSCFYNRDDIGLLGGEQMCLKPNKDNVQGKFLYYATKYFHIELNQYATGLKVYRFRLDDLKKINMVLPPKDEQYKIISFLDEKLPLIDQIISTKEKLLIEMEAYKKSLIYETVTGKREVE